MRDDDPLVFDEETLVLPVESVAALEAEGHGISLVRDGIVGRVGHQRLPVEARFDVNGAAALVMVVAVRALVGSPPGVCTLPEVSLAQLLGGVGFE